MKGKSNFFAKCFCMMIAVIVLFLAGDVDKAEAASLLIPVSEFTTNGEIETDAGTFFKSFSGGYLSGTATYPCLIAPVRIPGNATKINKVIVYLIDDFIGVSAPYFQLDALNMATGIVDNYTNAFVTNGTSFVQGYELPLSHKALVKGRVYQLGVCLDEGEYLYGAKVIYTVP